VTPEVMEVFEEFAENRKDMKKPLTPRARKARLEELEELSGGNPDLAIAILKQSIAGPWRGLFALKGDALARFRAKQLEAARSRKFPCEYCKKLITENQRMSHEREECPEKYREDPEAIKAMVDMLGGQMRVNKARVN